MAKSGKSQTIASELLIMNYGLVSNDIKYIEVTKSDIIDQFDDDFDFTI